MTRPRPTMDDYRKARDLDLLNAHPNQFYHTLDGAYTVYTESPNEPDGISYKPIACCIGLESVAAELRLMHCMDDEPPAPAVKDERPSATSPPDSSRGQHG